MELITWFVFFTSIAYIYPDCSKSLGMEDGTITDAQINSSHWLYYETGSKHYSSKYARLNLKSASGGWCSSDIEKFKNQYIEIDLLVNKKVTGVATQGRSGGNTEYIEKYQIMYQRDNENFFRKYSESGIWKTFIANEVNNKTVTNAFKNSVIARKIRLYPRGKEFTIYCMRMELYGCTWSHSSTGLVQYNAPQGGVRNGLDMTDIPYDGNTSTKTKTVTGGLGKLADDIYGQKALVTSKGSPWVAYNTKNPELKFIFAEKRLLKQLIIHVNNNGGDIQVFETVEIFISSDDVTYTSLRTYKTNKEQAEKIDSFAIVLQLGSDVVTKYVKLRFTKKSTWLLLSELVFISDTYPPKVDQLPLPSPKKPSIKLFTEKPSLRVDDDGSEKESEKSSGLSFPIILTIALVTVVLAVVVSIFIYKSYKKKRRHTPRMVTPPPKQYPPPSMNKQDMSLLYEERLLAMQQQQQQFQQQNALVANGMYMQPSRNSCNTRIVMS